MSTAVLISGQARTFARVYGNQRWYLYRHLDDPTFFVSVADDPDARHMKLLEKDFPGRVHIEVVKQPDIELPANIEDLKSWSAWPCSAPPQNVLRMFWHRQRVWEFMGGLFDALPIPTVNGPVKFVYVRPDLHFHCVPGSITDPDTGKKFPFGYPDPEQFLTPYWSRWGGINDRFAVMGCVEVARRFFNVFSNREVLWRSGCPFHPEAMLGESMNLAWVIPIPLLVEFSTLRPNGELVGPDVYPWDLAHLTK